MQRNKHLLLICSLLIIFVLILQTAGNNNGKLKIDIRFGNRISNINRADIQEAIKFSDEDIIDKDFDKKKTSVIIPKKPTAPVKSFIPKPYISAESYVVGNLETGEIYSSLNSDKIFPIASVSKLYTSLVTSHFYNTNQKIEITQSILDTYGESGNLTLGEKFSQKELLYALLLESSNDAAEGFAQTYGYDNFISQMNNFAKEIGMNNTSFKDASGLSSGNISNASDLFILAKYLYKNEREILDISKTKDITFATSTDHGFHHFSNINPYVYYKDFIGGKTGRTEQAKESMVSLFMQEIDNKIIPLGIVILRSDFGQREIDTEKSLSLFMDKVKRDDMINQ